MMDNREPVHKFIEKHIIINENDTVLFTELCNPNRIRKLFGENGFDYLLMWLKNKLGNEDYIANKGNVIYYYRNGVLHRDDGPAITGGATDEWYIYGHQIKVKYVK